MFLVERALEGRRGLMGALVGCSTTGGILLGSAVGAGFAASMSSAALDGWGWRIPLLLGLLVGVAGYILRRYVLDAAAAEGLAQNRQTRIEVSQNFFGAQGVSMGTAMEATELERATQRASSLLHRPNRQVRDFIALSRRKRHNENCNTNHSAGHTAVNGISVNV